MFYDNASVVDDEVSVCSEEETKVKLACEFNPSPYNVDESLA